MDNIKIGKLELRIEKYDNNITAYKNNEPYCQIDVTLIGYPLVDAVWVKVGYAEEKIADKIQWLERTNIIKSYNYNQYRLYNEKLT